MKGDLEDGDICPHCNFCTMGEVEPEGDCSCHISPPCSKCTTTRLMCDECGYEVTYGD